jgi:hypothetical protein
MELSTLEVVLIVVSVTETIVSAIIYRRWKKKLDNERRLYEDKRKEYERLIEALPIGRSLL